MHSTRDRDHGDWVSEDCAWKRLANAFCSNWSTAVLVGVDTERPRRSVVVSAAPWRALDFAHFDTWGAHEFGVGGGLESRALELLSCKDNAITPNGRVFSRGLRACPHCSTPRHSSLALV